MRKFYLFVLGAVASFVATAQYANFPAEITPVWNNSTTLIVPNYPFKSQILFVGGTDYVQTTATYGNPADSTLAKEWHDFIGFTADDQTSDLGWVSINHEMVLGDDKIGDGGGMTAFKIARQGDSLVILDQTLNDGRSGKFFNVDFVNTVGETGMNCGGINSSADGRIWTAEEWFRSGISSIYQGGNGVRDTADWTISASEFAGTDYDGQTVSKHQNFNYMVEIDPRQAVAVRKQYNWGRQGFEGGAILPDNQTVFLGEDNTPGIFSKFIANTPGDFTSGDLYVYKHDKAGNPWVKVGNASLDTMLNIRTYAWNTYNATMFNRIEWVVYDTINNKIYFTETGRDNPSGRWIGESQMGGVHAPHNLARATAQGTHPDSSDYQDVYGRVVMFDPVTNQMDVLIEGGPDYANSTSQPVSSYPAKHLSNPDGLGMLYSGGKTYLIINEDLNGTSYNRTPDGADARYCELYLLDLSISNATVNDLYRLAVTPKGAEVTGAIGIDENTILCNAQHSDPSNPGPYGHSFTFAINNVEKVVLALEELRNQPTPEDGTFTVWPNPVEQIIYMNKVTDVALYNFEGKRVNVYRNVDYIDVSELSSGKYILQTLEGETKQIIVE